MALDWSAWRSAAEMTLRDGESLMAIASVRTEPGDGGGLTMMPIGTLYRWLYRAYQARAAERASVRLGFPLRRRMIWALTDRRIVVWSRSRRPNGVPIGDYDRAHVLGAHRPDVGGAWRTLVLTLQSGEDLRVQVSGEPADVIAKELQPDE